MDDQFIKSKLCQLENENRTLQSRINVLEARIMDHEGGTDKMVRRTELNVRLKQFLTKEQADKIYRKQTMIDRIFSAKTEATNNGQ